MTLSHTGSEALSNLVVGVVDDDDEEKEEQEEEEVFFVGVSFSCMYFGTSPFLFGDFLIFPTFYS